MFAFFDQMRIDDFFEMTISDNEKMLYMTAYTDLSNPGE